MDTFNSNFGKDKETDTEFAYPASDYPATAPAQPKVPNGSFGFGLLKALRMNAQGAEATAPAEKMPATAENFDSGAAEFAGFISSKNAYTEPAPVYRGSYEKLCPLYFNTDPVDNANDTRLNRARLSSYSRAQLFFLLRLERFLRLRHYWEIASPRKDEQWKTELVARSIFSAYLDCVKHNVGKDAMKLLKAWNCC